MRRWAKGALFLVGLTLASPWIVWARIGMALRSEGPYSTSAYAVSGCIGLVGVAVRRAFYRFTLKSCPADFTTHHGTVVTHPTARIGRNVWIGAYSLIGRCSLGDDVIIGSRVSVLSGRHPHRFSDPDAPIQEQGGSYAEVRIGADCWLGEGSIIMADLGRGCVVGAGAVVVKPGDDYSILVGNPAHSVGKRGENPGTKS